jgi:hypothetical protein
MYRELMHQISKPQIAWAIQRPTGEILTAMIRAKRIDSINAVVQAVRDNNPATVWSRMKLKGFRAVRVQVLPMSCIVSRLIH